MRHMNSGDPQELEDHTRNYETIRVLAERNAMELQAMKELLKRLDVSLFGLGDGQGGVINKLTVKVNAHDKLIWVAAGFLGAMQFLSGSGTVSLKSLLGK